MKSYLSPSRIVTLSAVQTTILGARIRNGVSSSPYTCNSTKPPSTYCFSFVCVCVCVCCCCYGVKLPLRKKKKDLQQSSIHLQQYLYPLLVLLHCEDLSI